MTSKKTDDERESLLSFFADVDWNRWIDDDEVKKSMIAIKSRIDSQSSDVNDASMDLSNATRVKLVVVGDGAVGKTSLLISYQTKKFPTQYVPTVFENYTVPMKRDAKSNPVLLHLWDTAGQEEYDRLRPLSYPNSDIILLCFSTVNRASFEAVKIRWSPEVNHYLKETPKILVGTKVDLRDSGTADPHATEYEPISKGDGDALAKEIGATYVEVSAKTRHNLNKLFETAVDMVLESKGITTEDDGGHSSRGGASSSSSSDSKPEPKTTGRKGKKPAPVEKDKRCVTM